MTLEQASLKSFKLNNVFARVIRDNIYRRLYSSKGSIFGIEGNEQELKSVNGQQNGNDRENVVLADALNLLSPRKAPVDRPNISYKPSLLSHLTSGSLSEQKQFSEANLTKLLSDSLPEPSNNRNSVKEHLDHMLAGLNYVSSYSIGDSSGGGSGAPLDLLALSSKELLIYIKLLKSEQALVKVFEFFHYNNALTLKITTEIVLNKALVNLNKLPVQIDSLLLNDTKRNSFKNWSKEDVISLNIILLKKYHDLKKPLLIIRNLKENFESHYLPTIEGAGGSDKVWLSPFYERIIWKFYFEYLLQDEQYYIQRISRLRSTILIWESSIPSKSIDLFTSAFEFHKQDLNPLQLAFFKLCSSKLTKSLIQDELNSLSTKMWSPTLSKLKQLSIKYKIYTFPKTTESISMERKSTLYLFINSLESIILDEYVTKQGAVDSNSILEIMELFKEIKEYKETELMNIKAEIGINEWSNKLVKG